MKRLLLGILALTVAGTAWAITVNPASMVTADSEATALTIPYRDANGDFAAGTITATLTGTASAVADGAVTTAKLASDAVTSIKISDGQVTTDKIGADSVTSAKIADGEVTTLKIGAGSVTTAKFLLDLPISNIACVTTAKLLGTCTTIDIATGICNCI